MADLTELNLVISKLASALERFFSAQDPPIHPSDQPGIDAAVKQLNAIGASIPSAEAKRPYPKPEAKDEPAMAAETAVDPKTMPHTDKKHGK
jgi:hypothetical protein